MSKPKLKPKLVMEAVIEGKQLHVSFNLQDFKAKDNKDQKVLRALAAMVASITAQTTQGE